MSHPHRPVCPHDEEQQLTSSVWKHSSIHLLLWCFLLVKRTQRRFNRLCCRWQSPVRPELEASLSENELKHSNKLALLLWKSLTPLTDLLSLPVFRADGAASANPSRGPPPRAQPPSVARGNANNIVRDGVSFPPPERQMWWQSVFPTQILTLKHN